MELTSEEALKAVEAGLSAFDSLPSAIDGRVRSLVLYNSLVRGDYIPGASDIDLLAVFGKDPVPEESESIVGCFTNAPGLPARAEGEKPVFDIVCISVDELPLAGSPAASRPTRWKMLGFYAFDFVRNSRILRGEDFRPRLTVREPKTMLAERLARLKELWSKPRTEGLEYMTALGAGEFIRLAQLWFGDPTIDKRVVFANFRRFVPDFEGKEFAERLEVVYFTGAMRRMSAGERTAYLRECESFVEALADLLERALAS